MTLLEFLKEYAPIISAGLGLTALGFLVHLANLIRNSAKDKIEALEARYTAEIAAAQAVRELLEMNVQTLKGEAEREEKWHLRKVEDLQAEIDKNTEQLTLSFKQADISLDSLISQSSEGITEKVKDSLETYVSELLGRVQEMRDLHEPVSPDVYLEAGKGLMAIDAWIAAAEQFDKYLAHVSADWEVHFLSGVSYANSRLGRETDTSALRAYNETIAFMPEAEKISPNLKAKLFSYRAAILKRLGRLDEAEADLRLAEGLASESYAIRDVQYNLACVFAMRNDRENLFRTIRSLKKERGSEAELQGIRWHLKDYFSAFARDDEFLEMILPTDQLLRVQQYKWPSN